MFHIQRFDDVLKCRVWQESLLSVNGAVNKLLVMQQKSHKNIHFKTTKYSHLYNLKLSK